MSKWPMVRFADVLALTNTAVPSATLNTINLAGVFSFGRGLFKRGPLSPTETTYKSYNRLVADDFVISQPKAWEGAIARVTEEFDGWYLSPVFPTFRLDKRKIDPFYLEWFCKREPVWADLQRKSRGIGARRESVSPDQFLSVEIPLPPLPEQQRIVARIEALAEKVQEATGLQKEVTAGLEQLCRAMIFNETFASSTLTPMRELVRLREPDVIVHGEERYRFAGVYCFGKGVFKGQQKSGMEFAYPRLTRLKAGNFVYPKLMAWEGALGVVPPDCDGLMVSTEFPVFEIDESRVFPEVLDVYFRMPSVWPTLAGASTGTNVRRRRLNPSDFLDCRIPVPSRPIQEKLRQVKTRVDSVKQQQAQTADELAALLPSILDKAFKGEL